MLSVLASAKTMDFSPPALTDIPSTQSMFQREAEQIVATIRAASDLTSLMHISPALAKTAKQEYQEWGKVTGTAIYAYVGDVYKGFHARTLTRQDIEWAQDHIVISSGLYGLVRPLDQISAYRLEMKTKLPIGHFKDLYEFWGKKLAHYADEHANGTICMLTSDEYGKPISRYSRSRIITPLFFDKRSDGTVETVPIYSKMMRGVMARWMIDHRVDDPVQLVQFTGQGYQYDTARSTPSQPAFYREHPAPITWR